MASQQIENAIEIAWNPQADRDLKAQAFDFLDRLHTENDGWQICLSLATREPKASEVVRHFSLEVVNTAIGGGRLDLQALLFVKDALMTHIRTTYGAGSTNVEQDPRTIQNKMVQTITSLFASLYTSQWPDFFEDFLGFTKTVGSTLPDSAKGTMLYLKILISIHDEIADVLVSRTSNERARDNELKDLVRERDADKITRSWQEILSLWKSQDRTIVDYCLSTIGRWASWNDLSLFLNNNLLSILFEFVGSVNIDEGTDLRDASLNTFIEILSKKMKASDKLELIEVLKVQEVVSQLVASPPLNELRPTSSYDTDLAEIVAKLVNNTMVDIIIALESSQNVTMIQSRANAQIKAFLPHVLRFFSDEYDEICSSVIPCLTDLLTYLRKNVKGDADYTLMLPPILQAIVAKMRYDETSSWGNEDAQTDEAEFQDLRKRLQVLQQAVAAVDETLYIDTISNIVDTSLENFQGRQGQVDWRDIDLAMHEMFLFGEFAVKSGGLYSKTKPVSPAAECLVGMMFKLIESDVASFSHPAIQLQYMEICVRYSTFFEANPQHIRRVLENLVRFIHHDHPKVKARSWYLFYRFIRQTRKQLGNIAQTIIQAVADLLPIKAELPEENSDSDDMSSDDNDQSALAVFSSQLHLYEAIGCVCGTPAIPVESQVALVRSVMNPLFSDLQNHLDPARSGDERAILQIHHLIMALGTLARGFSDWSPASTSVSARPPTQPIAEEFTRTAEAILVALESLNSAMDIRSAARFAFSRLIGVIGNRILPQLTRWIDGLLSGTSSKDEMAMFLRLLDQVVYGFKTEIYDILNTLLTPFLQRVFAGLSEPTTGTDDEIQLSEFKLRYLSFLLIIFNNDLAPVFVSETNQPVFETLISTISHFAADPSDLPTAKLAISVLTRIVHTWGGPDIVPPTPTNPTTPTSPTFPTSTPTAQPTLPNFDQFTITRFSPLTWALASNPAFDPKDAQARQVLAEAAGLQKAIYAKTGEAYVRWLREVELVGMGMGQGDVEAYVEALRRLDAKAFRGYFQALVQRGKR